MLFDILNPGRILFGPGSTYRLGEEIKNIGQNILLVTGATSFETTGNAERILQPLNNAGVSYQHFNQVPPEPDTTIVDKGRKMLKANNCQAVLGVGGGSALDVAKAIAGLAHEQEPTRNFLLGQVPSENRVPFIAVPTTSGSGSEVTQNVVLKDPDSGQKKALRNEHWLPVVSIIDPILTMSMPKKLTIQTGLDALTHAIEAHTSRWANAYSKSLSREAVRLIVQNIYTACTVPGDRTARENMMLASLMAGMALNVARAGAVHALAHPVGAIYGVGHGTICGILLPYVMEFNLSLVDDKYADLSKHAGLVAGGTTNTKAAKFLLHYVQQLKVRLEVPTQLSTVGLVEKDFDAIIEATQGSGSLAANARKTTPDDLKDILQANL